MKIQYTSSFLIITSNRFSSQNSRSINKFIKSCLKLQLITSKHKYKSSMLSQSSIRSAKGANISLIRVQRRPASENQRRRITPSVVHLSSLIQSAKKKQVNRSLLEFTRRSSFEETYTEEVIIKMPIKTKETITLLNLQKLEKDANQRLIKKKKYDDQIFLSELTDQQPYVSPVKEAYLLSQQKDLLRSKRRNYVMRKLQFKNFLKHQQMIKNDPLVPKQQPKQVQYKNQKAKQQLYKFNIRNNSFDRIETRKNHHFLIKGQTNFLQRPPKALKNTYQ